MKDERLLGAAILMGGASSRMGSDKGLLVWNGRTAVDRVFELAEQAGASLSVAVGAILPQRQCVTDERLGPVGGVLSAVGRLKVSGCSRMMVLAVDAPTLMVGDLMPLLAAARGAAYVGQHFPVVFGIEDLPQDAEASWPMARLLERMDIVRLPCPVEGRRRVRGANTPEERAVLLEDLVRRESARSQGAD